jgi:NitT/TauT family transport system substrate-binding protein
MPISDLLRSRRWLSIPLAIAVAAGLAGRSPGQAPAVVTVAGPPNDSSGEMFYAADMGFFEKAGLHVQVTAQNGTGTLSSAVASGAVDIGSLTVPIVALARERGIPLVIIAPANVYNSATPTSGLVTLNSSTLRTAAGLSGKTVAVREITNMSYYGASVWIDKNGGDSKAVHFVEIPDSEDLAAMKQGRIDAASITEPDLAQALAGDARMMAPVYDAIAPRFLVGVYFTSEAYATAHPDVVRKFAQVIAETGAWANKNRDQSAAILARYTKNPMLPGIPRVTYGDVLRTSQVQPLLDVLVKYGALKKPVRAQDLFAPEVPSR